MAPLEVSVLLPVYNGEPHLAEQLDALSRQDFLGLWECILVDNGSTDQSLANARSHAQDLPLIILEAPQARGKPGAMNVAAASARGTFLVFCDQDDVVSDNWLTQMVAALRSYPAIGGFADEEALNGEGVALWRPPITPNGLDVPFGYLPAPLGANAGVDAKLFRAVGGFDTQFTEAAEDTDLFWRVGRLGYPAQYAPTAVIAYRHRLEPRHLFQQYRRYGRAQAKLAAKYADVFEPDPWWRTAVALSWCVLHAVDVARGGVRRVRYLRVLWHTFGQLEASHRTGFRRVGSSSPKRRQSKPGDSAAISTRRRSGGPTKVRLSARRRDASGTP